MHFRPCMTSAAGGFTQPLPPVLAPRGRRPAPPPVRASPSPRRGDLIDVLGALLSRPPGVGVPFASGGVTGAGEDQ